MTIFTVTDTATPGAQSQQYEKPLEAYRKAVECEAGGRSVVIKLPNGDEISAKEFERLYLLRDAD